MLVNTLNGNQIPGSNGMVLPSSIAQNWTGASFNTTFQSASIENPITDRDKTTEVQLPVAARFEMPTVTPIYTSQPPERITSYEWV